MMEVISTRRYEVRPPATSSSYPGIIVDPENSVALVKEEEWETRKKKEITTTRQIETRVKRQVVLEDGEVVVDSGPLVTTNTTEDVEQQEHTTQERRTTGDHPQEVEWPTNGTIDGSVVQKELNETVVRSREEIEERLETEDRQQLGDISDEAYQKAIRNNRGDLRIALAESTKQIIPQSGPRVIHHTTRSNKVVDTEKTSEKQELKADGSIVTEKKQTIEHEEVNDDEVPDDGSGIGGDNASETRKEASQKFLRKREEDVVDYVSGGERIAREMRYVAETTEGERIGDWVPPPTTMRTNRLHKHSSFAGENAPAARKDALTKKPLDFEEEDEARKFETSKWLESHFGSESRSSHGSIDADDSPLPPSTNISYINVTMKSCSTPKERREYQNFDSSRYNRRTTGRDSTSPSGYFHGISEWSERYQGNEKENDHVRTASPSHYADAPRVNGHSYERGKNQMESTYCRSYESVRRREECVQERQRTPSPPVRRKNRDQWSTRSMEKPSPNKSTSGRTSSPIHVVQRTWESRSRDVQEQNAERDTYKRPPPPPRSRSTSPKQVTIVQEEKKPSESTGTSRPSKSSGQSKYKIGESFRKLVGKLRSASTERKNKRSSSSSTSQLTQTEDNGPTYMQYNVVDRNIPLVSDREAEEKPPERPPRSPRNSGVQVKPPKTIRTSDHGTNHYDQSQSRSSDATTPVHRYYLGEDPFGGSIYGREKGYAGARRPGRSRGKTSVETDHSVVSSSLDRFSRSTSRLVMDREMDEQFRSAQTLPRNMHSGGRSGRQQQTSLAPSTSRRQQQVRTTVGRTSGTSSTMAPSRQYGSMINISIKNAVVSPKPQTLQPPVKPERTYRSSLSRSKSFNVEADKNGNDAVPLRIPCKSSLQLNRLDETPPLKSPGILASISRSNRDLFRDSRCDH